MTDRDVFFVEQDGWAVLGWSATGALLSVLGVLFGPDARVAWFLLPPSVLGVLVGGAIVLVAGRRSRS